MDGQCVGKWRDFDESWMNFGTTSQFRNHAKRVRSRDENGESPGMHYEVLVTAPASTILRDGRDRCVTLSQLLS